MNKKSYDSLSLRNKHALRITVFVKEDFEWERRRLPVAQRGLWTTADAKKYGNLTIMDIKVIVKPLPSIE